MKICIPTKSFKGEKAKVHAHFGSADYFTIVDLDSGLIETVINNNSHHAHGLCQPLSVIGDKGINVIISQGMGARVVQKLNEAGIKAYKSAGITVEEVIKQYQAKELEELTIENACMQHNCH